MVFLVRVKPRWKTTLKRDRFERQTFTAHHQLININYNIIIFNFYQRKHRTNRYYFTVPYHTLCIPYYHVYVSFYLFSFNFGTINYLNLVVLKNILVLWVFYVRNIKILMRTQGNADKNNSKRNENNENHRRTNYIYTLLKTLDANDTMYANGFHEAATIYCLYDLMSLKNHTPHRRSYTHGDS